MAYELGRTNLTERTFGIARPALTSRKPYRSVPVLNDLLDHTSYLGEDDQLSGKQVSDAPSGSDPKTSVSIGQ